MLYSMGLGSIRKGTHVVDIGENPYLNLITQFLAAILLHVTMQPKVAEAI
jgi:hypothetical protein